MHAVFPPYVALYITYLDYLAGPVEARVFVKERRLVFQFKVGIIHDLSNPDSVVSVFIVILVEGCLLVMTLLVLLCGCATFINTAGKYGLRSSRTRNAKVMPLWRNYSLGWYRTVYMAHYCYYHYCICRGLYILLGILKYISCI